MVYENHTSFAWAQMMLQRGNTAPQVVPGRKSMLLTVSGHHQSVSQVVSGSVSQVARGKNFALMAY